MVLNNFMIGKITGKLIEIDYQENSGLIETRGGISFNVFLPTNLKNERYINQEVSLYTHLQLRDDRLILYGFLKKEEYFLFLKLINVDTIGPKTAFNIINSISCDQLIEAVKTNNLDLLTSIPGLGKKTALKIIVELSSKLKEELDLKKINLSQEDKDLIEALKSLGYKNEEIKKIVSKIPVNLSLEERIKKALQMLK